MMGLFGPSKGSINKVVSGKITAGKPRGGGSASKIQAQQARDRKKEIKEALAQKKQEEKDIKRCKLLHNNQTDPAKIRKQKQKAIAAGDKRREKKAEKKAAGKGKLIYWK